MRQTRRLVLVTTIMLPLLALAAPGEAKEAADRQVVEGALGAELDGAVTKAYPEFWGSVLVAKEGEILLAKGYGKADYATTPNTARTLHEIASASKQVVGAAIVHLQQRKKLKLTDTIDKFFKKVPDDKQGITVHHLLTHTSGISGNVGVPYSSTLARAGYIKKMMAEELAAEPGERYEYCNVGYALLAAIVEEVTKGTYEAYVEKYLFKPAKMKDSGFIGDKDLKKSGRASTRKGRIAGKTAADWFYGWGYRGMGGVVTTVHDLYRWDRALRGEKLLKKESLDALYKPFKNGYACGWEVTITDRGTTKVHHSGGVEGFGCNVIRYLEDDVCVFVLSNGGEGAHRVSHALEKALLEPVAFEVEIDVSSYGRGGRTVEFPKKLRWSATRKKDLLHLQLEDKRDVILAVALPRKTYGKKLLHELEQAILSRYGDDAGDKAAFGGALWLRGYGPSAKIKHPFGSAEIRAELRSRDAGGAPSIDRRVAFVLSDTRSGGRTGAVLMNVAAAQQLQKVLQKHVK